MKIDTDKADKNMIGIRQHLHRPAHLQVFYMHQLTWFLQKPRAARRHYFQLRFTEEEHLGTTRRSNL